MGESRAVEKEQVEQAQLEKIELAKCVVQDLIGVLCSRHFESVLYQHVF